MSCFKKILVLNIFRYLAYVMDVATPTADCLTLVYDLLMPVLMKGHSRTALSHQEVVYLIFSVVDFMSLSSL